MRRAAVALAVLAAGCAHHGAPTVRPTMLHTVVIAPRTVQIVTASPATERAPRNCHAPAAPALPDAAAAPGLAEAVKRLTARDQMHAAYERELVAALTACGAKP